MNGNSLDRYSILQQYKDRHLNKDPVVTNAQDANMAHDFFGNLVWGGLSSASWGALDIFAASDPGKVVRGIAAGGAYRPWEEQTPSGKAGYIIGQGIGMLPTFGFTGKILSSAARAIGLGKSGSAVGRAMSKRAGNAALEKFGSQKANQSLAKYGEAIMRGETADVAMEGLERGTIGIMDEAFELVTDPRYKKLWKGNQTSYANAVDELSGKIIGHMGDIGQETSVDLASHLLSSALKYSNKNFHNVMEGVAGALGTKVPALAGKGGQVLAAYSSDFALGLTHQLAKSGIENAVYGLTSQVGLDYDDKELQQFKSLNSGFLSVLGDAGMSGVWMGFIGPTRFIRGGRSTKLFSEIRGGLNTVRKAWKPLGKMTEKQAKATLTLIDNTSANKLKEAIPELVGKDISLLSKKETTDILDKVRKTFSKEWGKYMLTEAKKDIVGSAPRMIAGAMAMNLHSIHDYYKEYGTIGIDVLGTDGAEIAANLIVGMVMSKGARTFGDMNTSKTKRGMWERGEIREYYTNNVKEMRAVKHGLELLGIRGRGDMLDYKSPSSYMIGRHLVNTGEYREVDDILRPFFVVPTDTEVPLNAKPLDKAYREFNAGSLDKTQEAKLEIAIQVMSHYDNSATDIGTAMRHVTPKEAESIVNSVNSIKGLSESKTNPTIWMNKIEKEALHKANLEYKELQDNFIFNLYQAIGIDLAPLWSKEAGVMGIPRIDLGKIIGTKNIPSDERGNDLRALISAHSMYLEMGKDSFVRQEGKRTDIPEASPEAIKLLKKAYNDAVTVMSLAAYGESANMRDKNILSDKNMWDVYKASRTDVDIANSLYIGTHESNREHLFTSFSKEQVRELDEAFETLRLGEMKPIKEGDKIKDSERIQELVDYHAKVKNFHHVLRGAKGRGDAGTKDVTFDTIAIAKETIDKYLGGIFGNKELEKATYERMMHKSLEHMVDTLNIQSLNRDNQLKHSLVVLMNGSALPGLSQLKGIGGLARREGKFIEMPTSDILFNILEKSPYYKNNKEEIDGLRSYYEDFELGMKSSDGPIRLRSDISSIDKLIDSLGGTGNVITLLNSAKLYSQVGHIKDFVHGYTKLEEYHTKLTKDQGIYLKGVDEIFKYDKDINTNFIELVKNLDTLKANLKFLLDTWDYEALVTMNIKELGNLVNQLESFKKKDITEFISEEGTVEKAYKDQLAEMVLLTQEKLHKRVGTFENINAYVNEQINKSPHDIPARDHVQKINTTPTKFEADYGVTVREQERIIEDMMGDKLANELRNDEIITALESIVNKATRKEGQSLDQLYSDSWQVVSSKVFSEEVGRVRFEGTPASGKLVESRIRLPLQSETDSRGLLGLRNWLFKSNIGWFDLQSDIKWRKVDSDSYQTLTVLDKDIMGQIDSILERGVSIENLTARNETLRQTFKKAVGDQETVQPQKVARVVIAEGTQLVVELGMAQRALNDAFAEGRTDNLHYLAEALIGKTEANKLSERFRIEDMSVEDVKDGITEAWNLLNKSNIYVEGDLTRTQQLEYMKRRKIADFSKGHMLTDRYHDWMTQYYNLVHLKTGSDASRIMAEAYSEMRGPDGEIIPMKGLSINDGVKVTDADGNTIPGSMFVSSRFKQRLKEYEKEGMLAGITETELMNELNKIDKELTDAPTYLSKKAFLRFLGTFAPRKEFLQIENGELVGFNVGAMKPKGANVSISPDGSLQVYYNKSAFFYNPTIAERMELAGLDQVTFKSGNKINKERSGREELEDMYVNPVTEVLKNNVAVKAESTEEIILNTIDRAREGGAYENMVREVPWETYMVTMASTPHRASVGANTGVHYSDRSGLNNWTRTDVHIDDFRTLFSAMHGDPYAVTSIGRKLSTMERQDGEMNPNRSSLDAYLDANGVVTNDWMGDMIVDNLFSRIFSGSKIGTYEVDGSSYSPMEPFIADRNVDLPILYQSGDGGRRQRIFGGFQINSELANMPFKPYDVSTHTNLGGDSNANVGSFFIVRNSLYNPAIKAMSKSDFMVIPGKKGKVSIIVEGMELLPDGSMVDLLTKKSMMESDVDAVTYRSNSKLYTQIKALANEVIDFGNGKTNDAVLNFMAEKDNIWMGALNLRQPRNSYDVIINKVHRESTGIVRKGDLIPDSKRVKGEPYIKDGKKIYDVLVDMYEHPTRRDKTGDLVDIWVVDNLEQARAQLAAIKKGVGKGTKFANKIVKHKDHYILKHQDGDNKEIYIKGTEPKGKEVEGWKHYEEGSGNATRQNALDVLRQDADHDFDKTATYITSTREFLKEVGSTIGHQVKVDANEYALLVDKEADFAIRNHETLKEWFRDVNNSSKLRGRFVKLHQMMSYLSNAIGEGGVVGEYLLNKQEINITMKDKKSYIDTIDNVAGAVKLFLDNYKTMLDIPIDKQGFSRIIDQTIKDILFGREFLIDGQVDKRKSFVGLFSVQAKDKKGFSEDIIKDERIKNHLYDTIIRPLGRYLTYNRGEFTEGETKSKIRLKDIYTGMSDMKNSYFTGEKPFLFNETLKLNLDAGKKTMQDFLTETSRAPFDIAMRSLYSMYDKALERDTAPPHRPTPVEDLIFKGERNLLTKPFELENVQSISRDIAKLVKSEGQMANLIVLSDKLASITGEYEKIKSNPYSTEYEIKQIENRLNYYTELKSDLEMVIGSRENYLSSNNVFTFRESKAPGTVPAYGSDWVIWSGGRDKPVIKQVIKEGETNKDPIGKNDVIVIGGKKFEIASPTKQTKLRSRWIAFGKPLLKTTLENSDVVSMTDMAYRGTILPAYSEFTSSFRKLTFDYMNYQDGQLLSNQRKALLHTFFNDISGKYGLTDELKRKAFIYRLLTPELMQDTFTIMEKNGEYTRDFKFTDNEKISKTVYGYLTEVMNKEGWSKENVLSANEAKGIISELAKMQNLAYYGISSPYNMVEMDVTRTERYINNFNKRLINIDNDVLKTAAKMTDVKQEEALTMINQFINGDRLITPFDMARIARNVGVGTTTPTRNMFRFGESGNFNRKFGLEGRDKIKTNQQGLDAIREKRCK